MGFEHADDAGVVQLNDSVALVQTVDFFTPIVDDPYRFGMIAAANALSDVFAMGGRPLSALNIVCFPSKDLPVSVLEAIMQGGQDKLVEAGGILTGGHTVRDKELKYGMAVTGLVHPANLGESGRTTWGCPDSNQAYWYGSADNRAETWCNQRPRLRTSCPIHGAVESKSDGSRFIV